MYEKKNIWAGLGPAGSTKKVLQFCIPTFEGWFYCLHGQKIQN